MYELLIGHYFPHTLIETCKNTGLNVKEYFTYVFRKLIEGETDYEKLLPGAVAL